MAKSHTIHAAFLPLLDAAPLIVAADKGFAAAENIDLRLVREASWANVRDRMSVGHFEVGHMLAPMPVAAALGLSVVDPQIVAPMALGFGGNTVTISSRLAARIRAFAPFDGLDAAPAGVALKTALREWGNETGSKPVFAVVHRFSSHNLDLRYWLAASGICPDHDMEIRIVPPPLMPAQLVEGRIDGFCVGEPWGSAAVAAGAGQVLTAKASIWKASPEKVLGLRKSLLTREPEMVEALVRAIYRAAKWCGTPENHTELLLLLSAKHRLNVPAERLIHGLAGRFDDLNGRSVTMADFYTPAHDDATFPWKSHALWFYTQMVRWGMAEWQPDHAALVQDAYRPDIYRRALASMGQTCPPTDFRLEGEPRWQGQPAQPFATGFFDGLAFDPAKAEAYINLLKN